MIDHVIPFTISIEIKTFIVTINLAYINRISIAKYFCHFYIVN